MILFIQIQPGQPLDEMSIACILLDLLHAIEYLHNGGKIHRDIKGSPWNLFAIDIDIEKILMNLILKAYMLFLGKPFFLQFIILFSLYSMSSYVNVVMLTKLIFHLAAANILLTDNGDVKVHSSLCSSKLVIQCSYLHLA